MKLKKLREKMGLSQEQVARKAGISLYAYQLIERGTTAAPRTATLKKLKEILGNGKTSN